MHRFKVGQEVVAVRDHSQGFFKKGDEFIVDGYACCPKCGEPCIHLKGINIIDDSICNGLNGCIHRERNVRASFAESSFAPKQSLSDAIEYRLSVSIKELEVKEYQQQ